MAGWVNDQHPATGAGGFLDLHLDTAAAAGDRPPRTTADVDVINAEYTPVQGDPFGAISGHIKAEHCMQSGIAGMSNAAEGDLRF